MSTPEEISALEDRLRLAELGPDAAFFETALDDEAILDGERLKSRVVEAHRTTAQKFTNVEMRGVEIIDHGDVAVVTGVGHYEGPQFTGDLKFMRIWHKRDGRWQIIAGTTAKI